jgi:Ca2+-binding RTX toxin-like protein
MAIKKGTRKSDRLIGDNGPDLLQGLAGHDTLIGGYGNDTLDGGAGDDLLIAGAGADRVEGGLGDDRINLYEGTPTADTIIYDFIKVWNGLPSRQFPGDDTVTNFGRGDRFDLEDVNQRGITQIKISDGAEGTEVLFLSGMYRVGSVLLESFDAKDVAEGRQTSLVVKGLADSQINQLLHDVLF